MPYSRKRKRTPYRRRRRTYKKRRFNRKRRFGTRGGGWKSRYVARIKYPRGGSIAAFPQQYWCKMPYMLAGTITSATLEDVQTYVMNAIYDVKNGGDVQFAIDLTELYKNWAVVGLSYEYQYFNRSNDTGYMVTLLPWGNINDVPTSFRDMDYSRGCQTRVVGTANSGSSKVTLKGYVNMSEITGFKVTREKDWWGTDSGIPALRANLYTNSTSLNSTFSVQDYQFRMKMVFYVKWFNPHGVAPPALTDVARRSAFLNEGVHCEKEMMELATVKATTYDEDMEALAEEKEEMLSRPPLKRRDCVVKNYGSDGAPMCTTCLNSVE